MNKLDIFVGNVVNTLINPLLFLLMALALAYFFWGGAQFILNADNTEVRKKGKQAMLYGLVGLFIMTAVLGILGLLMNSFGIDTPRGINLPR